MTSREEWNKVRDLFDRAKDLDLSQRELLLAECNEAERGEVVRLLSSFDKAPEFLESTPHAGPEIVNAVAEALHVKLSGDPIPGQTLKDRYLVEEKIGQGGFGRVYRAKDLLLNSRPVVVKVLSRPVEGDRWWEQRFVEERNALATIDHPGVVGILDFGQTAEGSPYLVMQYVPGRTLRDVLSDGPLAPARLLQLTAQIADALDAAHRRGVCHRDLKPANIQIRDAGAPDERAVILDFGIARILDAETPERSTRVAGSPAYMAPEQLRGKARPASDIYAFGVVVYEMLTGENYGKLDVLGLTEEVIGRRLQERPDVSPETGNAVRQAVASNAEERFQSALEFAAALRRSIEPASTPRWTWTWKWITAAAATLLVALATGGYFLAFQPLSLSCSVQDGWLYVDPSEEGYLSVFESTGGEYKLTYPAGQVRPGDGTKLAANGNILLVSFARRPVIAAVSASTPVVHLSDLQRTVLVPGSRQNVRAQLQLEPALLSEAQFRQGRVRDKSSLASGWIGVTLWRLRPSKATDRARVIYHERPTQQAVEFTPERIDLKGRLGAEEKLRFSVETGWEGHLYVASREVYSDGTKGPAYLIFPSQRIFQGDSRVRPGRMVDIPEESNAVPYLTFQKRKNQTAEEVIVALLSKPVAGLMVGAEVRPVRVPEELLGEWMKGTETMTERVDLQSAASGAWTPAERSSARRESVLTPADPVPQRLYRLRRDGKSGQAAVSFPLTLEQ